jgi:plastocyanin
MFKKIILAITTSLILSGCTLPQSSKIVTGGITNNNLTENSIQIKNYAYDPTDVVAKAGDKITITNNDSVAHTVTADDKSFDSGTINPGETMTLTMPLKNGSFGFYCTFHPYMRGKITLSGAPTPTPTD